MPTKNPYIVLGVTTTATAKEIRQAYFKLAKRYHPDNNSNPLANEKFNELHVAYETLTRPSSDTSINAEEFNSGQASETDLVPFKPKEITEQRIIKENDVIVVVAEEGNHSNVSKLQYEDFRVLNVIIKLSHFMGISEVFLPKYNSGNVIQTNKPAKTEKTFSDFILEANDPYLSLQWLAIYLKKMEDESIFSREDSHCINQLATAFDIASRVNPNDSKVNAELEIQVQRIKHNQLVVMPSGWEKHSIGIALINNRLIVTNTGENANDKPGTLIYEFDPQKITPDLLRNLIYQDTPAGLDRAITAIVSDKEPIYHFHESQKVGNCSVSNPKKSIEEMIACLKIFYTPSSLGEIKTSDIQEALKNLDNHPNDSLFKRITKQMRIYALADYENTRQDVIANGTPDQKTLIEDADSILTIKHERKHAKKHEKKMGDSKSFFNFFSDTKNTSDVAGFPAPTDDEIKKYPIKK